MTASPYGLPCRRRSATRGFTLIELLTVIAIIGILAAIIIPTVAKVRESARWTQGSSNVRQITMALIAYTNDNRGRFMVGMEPATADHAQGWSFTLNHYLSKTNSTYGRPLTELLLDPVARAQWPEPVAYAKQFGFFGWTRRADGHGEGSSGPALAKFNKIDTHRTPSQQLFMADAGLDANGDSNWDLWRADGGWLRYPATPADSEANTPITPGSNGGGDIRWTDGKAKFTFLDGRVQVLRQSEVLKRNFNPFYQ